MPESALAALHARLLQLKGSVLLVFPSSDNEAQYLAIQLAKAFEKTPWTVGMQSRTYSNMVIFGIIIPGPVTQDVISVREAFTAAGIPFFPRTTYHQPVLQAAVAWLGRVQLFL